MQVSHARPGGQAAEMEHAALILASRELVHTYPALAIGWVSVTGSPPAKDHAVDLARWMAGALQILQTIVAANSL